jgi:hypothetical protein
MAEACPRGRPRSVRKPIGLRGLAVVELEHAAKPRPVPDRAGADRRRRGRATSSLPSPWCGRSSR